MSKVIVLVSPLKVFLCYSKKSAYGKAANAVKNLMGERITSRKRNINELLELAEDKHFISLSGNDVLFHENEPIKGVYFLLSGRIKITKSCPENMESTLYIITPPDIICLHSVMEDEYHMHTAVADTDSRVCFVPKKELEKILAENANIAFNLMKLLCLKINVIENQISRFI